MYFSKADFCIMKCNDINFIKKMSSGCHDFYHKLFYKSLNIDKQNHILDMNFNFINKEPVYDSEKRFLFRVLGSDRGSVSFYVVSKGELKNMYEGWNIQSRIYNPFIRIGDVFRFCVRLSLEKRIFFNGKRSYVNFVEYAVKDRVAKNLSMMSKRQILSSEGGCFLKKIELKSGFIHQQKSLKVYGYDKRVIEKKGGRSFSVPSAEFEGYLKVTDPMLFKKALFNGIGRQKAYGCGLMMISR